MLQASDVRLPRAAQVTGECTVSGSQPIGRLGLRRRAIGLADSQQRAAARCFMNKVLRTFIVAALAAVSTSLAAQDRIVLRNLDVIRNQKVASLSVDGLRLDDDRLIGWDEIEKVKTSSVFQAQADKMIADLGTPLYRIRQRMKVGDYSSIRALAEQVEPHFKGRKGPASLMVSQAKMWGSLSDGSREQALIGHLESLGNLMTSPKLVETLPGKRRPLLDLKTGISQELLPIWFDRVAAKEVYPTAIKLAGAMPSPRPPGVYLYCATLALTVGDQAMAIRMVRGIPNEARGVHWRLIVATQMQTLNGNPLKVAEQLREAMPACAAGDRPLALFWLARSDMASAATQPHLGNRGMLEMLRLPAVFGDSHPEVAGAALHQTMVFMQANEQLPQSIRVRRELLERFPQTYYGRKHLAASNDTTPDARSKSPAEEAAAQGS